MNIIIVDKNADIPIWKDLLDDWKVDFQERGHYVDGPYAKLIEGDDQNVESYKIRDLDKYQIALAHPNYIQKDGGSIAELNVLNKEIKKRPEFRVIFYSGDTQFEKHIDMRQSSQVYYICKDEKFAFQRIIELIENGW